MKAFRILLIGALFPMLLLQNCKEDNDNEGNENPQSIVGKWSITSQGYVVKDASGNVEEDETFTYAVNEFTFEFKDDGTFVYIHIEDGDWVAGTYTYNSSTGELTITILGDAVSGEVQNLTATTITIFISNTFTDAGNTFTEENTFSGSLNGASIPTFTFEEILTKWSVKDLLLKSYADVNDDDEFDEVVELYFTLDLSNIPHNRNTIEFMSDGHALSIDTYIGGEWYEQSWVMLDGSNLLLDDGDEEQLLHLTGRTGDTFEFKLISYSFDEIESSFYYVKTVGMVTVIINNGSEPTLPETDFLSAWEITDFIEYKNGEEDPGGEGAPIGAIITFNNNGTGSLVAGMDEFDLVNVTQVDESNFYFEFDSGDEYNEVLLNVQSYNPETGALEVVQGEIREEYDEGLMEDVLVQRESFISLEKQ